MELQVTAPLCTPTLHLESGGPSPVVRALASCEEYEQLCVGSASAVPSRDHCTIKGCRPWPVVGQLYRPTVLIPLILPFKASTTFSKKCLKHLGGKVLSLFRVNGFKKKKI